MRKTIQIMIDKRGCVTNGDVIKAMFPKVYVQKILDNSDEVIGFKTWLDGGSQCFMADWWNSPYKESDTDEHN